MLGLFKDSAKEVHQSLSRLDARLQKAFTTVRSDMQNLSAWISYLHQKMQAQDAQLQQALQESRNASTTARNNPGGQKVSPEFIQAQVSASPQMHFLQNSLSHLQLRMSELADSKGVSPQDFHALSSKVSDLREKFHDLGSRVSRIDSIEHEIDHKIGQNMAVFEQKVSSRLDSVEQKVGDVWQRLDDLAKKPSVKETRQQFKEKIMKKITRHSKEYIRNMILSLIKKYERVSALNLREIIVEEQALCSKSSFYRFLEELEKSDEIESFSEGKEKFFVYKVVREV